MGNRALGGDPGGFRQEIIYQQFKFFLRPNNILHNFKNFFENNLNLSDIKVLLT